MNIRLNVEAYVYYMCSKHVDILNKFVIRHVGIGKRNDIIAIARCATKSKYIINLQHLPHFSITFDHSDHGFDRRKI